LYEIFDASAFRDIPAATHAFKIKQKKTLLACYACGNENIRVLQIIMVDPALMQLTK
jgi:hypothetical protein